MRLKGYLKNSVEIHSYTETQDALGQPVKTWTKASTINAFINDNGGKKFQNGQDIVYSTALMVCDASTTITELNKIKVVETGKYYDVLFVNIPLLSQRLRKDYKLVDLKYSAGSPQ